MTTAVVTAHASFVAGLEAGFQVIAGIALAGLVLAAVAVSPRPATAPR